MTKNKAKRIKIFGEGGQGVQFMADTLIRYLAKLGFYATFLPEYDAAVRGGQITAEVAFNQKQTPCPQDTEFNAIFCLSGNEKTDGLVVDKKFQLSDLLDKDETYKNTRVLGQIISFLELPFNKEAILAALPDKRKDSNYQLVKEGYQAYGSQRTSG
ncbi:MAG: 2-oxoacid:acceptor oxidoreductase family protein [Patescibacteria group bacterium]|nr:2-oxoacid:acceptor oxidoreductase family protein [Patescibacteria group bacterium]